MICKRDTLMIIIAVNKDCNLIDIIIDLKMNKFINYWKKWILMLYYAI